MQLFLQKNKKKLKKKMVQVIFTAFLRISRKKKIRKRSFRLFLISILYYYFYGEFLTIPMVNFSLSLW